MTSSVSDAPKLTQNLTGLDGEKPTQESLQLMSIAYQIGIYILSFAKDPKDPVGRVALFYGGPNPAKYDLDNRYQHPWPFHTMNGLALSTSEGVFLSLHTPFGEWDIRDAFWSEVSATNPEDKETLERLKKELGAVPLTEDTFAITQWKGAKLPIPEYRQVSKGKKAIEKAYEKIRKLVTENLPGIRDVRFDAHDPHLDQRQKYLVEIVNKTKEEGVSCHI